jgi:hypothetical protein
MLRLGSWLLCTYPAGGVAVGVLVAANGILLAAPAPFPSRKPVTGDLKKMQGRWVQVGWEAWRLHPGCWRGFGLSQPCGKGGLYKLEGDTLSVRAPTRIPLR